MRNLTPHHRPSRPVLGLAGLGVLAAAAAGLSAGVGPSGAAPPDPSEAPSPTSVHVDWSDWEVRCMRVPSAHRDVNPTYCVVPEYAAENGSVKPGFLR